MIAEAKITVAVLTVTVLTLVAFKVTAAENYVRSAVTDVMSAIVDTMLAALASVMSAIELCVLTNQNGDTAELTYFGRLVVIYFLYVSNDNIDILVNATRNKCKIAGNRVIFSVLECAVIGKRKERVLKALHLEVVVTSADSKSTGHGNELTHSEVFHHALEVVGIAILDERSLYLIAGRNELARGYILELIYVPISRLRSGQSHLVTNGVSVRLLGVDIQITAIVVGEHKICHTRRADDTLDCVYSVKWCRRHIRN